jgi:hypothetical protein
MYLLFDMGYLLFYRYHATMRWVEFQKEYEKSPENIIQTFTNHLTSQLDKLRKKYKTQFHFLQRRKACPGMAQGNLP